MKVGCQTISWGRALSDGGGTMLNAIRDAGYDGVEIAQHPGEFNSARSLYELLRDYGTEDEHKRKQLKLLGLAGGSISERITFLEELTQVENRDLLTWKEVPDRLIGFDEEHPYIYTDTCDNGLIASAGQIRWKFGLHAHMFKPIQTASEALAVIGQHPELRFLPDTAHLTIAGEDVIGVLQRAFAVPIVETPAGERAVRAYGPVVAIHLKDWTSEFGRSYQFYSRGFGVQFGEGEVKLDKIVRFLRDARYDGWVVVEQDVVDNAVGAIRACRRWLEDRGI